MKDKNSSVLNIEIHPALLGDKPVLRNLLELCSHDYSEYDNADVDEHGLFGYDYLDPYWTEKGRHPFFIRVAGRLAGFVLVRDVRQGGRRVTHTIAEFFVMRKYRRRGVGRQVAWMIFDSFPGRWSVSQEQGNLPAQNFWRQVIAEYTHGMYEEEHLMTEEWHGPCQTFSSH